MNQLLSANNDIPAVFSEVVLKRPTSIAIDTDGRPYTFEEVEMLADYLACVLIEEISVEPRSVVGVCFRNCPDAVIALLAILKCGAIFVPLDPDHPPPRSAQIIADSSVKLVLTTGRLRDECIFTNANKVVAVDEVIAPSRKRRESPSRQKSEACCIIYTSGSTGKPKGVVRSHQGVIARLEVAPVSVEDRIAHYMSLCYGFSQERLFVPLLSGATLAILGDECQKDAKLLAMAVDRHRVTHITVVPAVLDQLVSGDRHLSPYLGSLRSLTVASAPLSRATVQRFRDLLPNVRLYNHYGSTEGGTLTRGEMTDVDIISVGRPVSYAKVTIVDEQLRSVPIGQDGQICAEGPSLAIRYWNDDALTRERFMDGGLQPDCQGRVFLTGDRGRILEDGRIVVLGRIDRQVKVRGYRVQPEEIETVIRQVDGVSDTFVTSTMVGADHRLIAYVVCSATKASPSPIRKRLRSELPEHMLPSSFVFLEKLPRTPNGKINSTALPAPGRDRALLDVEYAPPGSELEDELATIWAELFEIDCVGTNDHILDLGGDSLIAARISVAVEEQLGITLTVINVLEHPTVLELATFIEGLRVADVQGMGPDNFAA